MKLGSPAKFRRIAEERITWSGNTKQERKRLQDSVWDRAWTCGCSTCELRHLDNNLPDTFLMEWGRPRQHKLSEGEEWAQHKAVIATKTDEKTFELQVGRQWHLWIAEEMAPCQWSWCPSICTCAFSTGISLPESLLADWRDRSEE